ncbi:hypothetical protein SAMN06264364_11166 [Quadrisphaera granulorum]|uniref:FtsX-like permease family protein n=1 Tax=Quadrisphaera granulorum TaxID=317664 RepID=A0A316A7S5_9ACTN|nr:hypothetical protein [Quadrisphaera granulorum]PWJ53663.1 hypothetical protein BXY45_11166 [Quadrisphaera granulorum]SZE96707.1 hypothetical protein SAMN06264364_11166 [Quadrisphaera granulorum]
MTATAPTPLAARPLPAEVVRELARLRSSADHLRARATAAAAAGIGVALLMAVSVAAIPNANDPDVYQLSAAQPGLAPYLSQSGLRPGAVMAALLLVLPFAALAVQALRVGSLALHRQAGLLALAGATPADLRQMRVARTRSAFLRGGLYAAPAYLVLWLLLGLALPPGTRLLPAPQWWLPLAWAVVLAVLAGVGALLGVRTPLTGDNEEDGVSAALVRLGARSGRPVRLWWAVASGVAAALVVSYGIRWGSGSDYSLPLLLLLLGAAVLLAATCAALLLARWAASSPVGRQTRRVRSARQLRRGDAAVAMLAGAQRRANPVAAGTVGAVLFVCGLSFGVEAVLVTSMFTATYGYGTGDLLFYIGGAAVAATVAVVGALVALLALALSLSDHLLATRRSVAAVAALGLEPRRLLGVQRRALTDTAVPAVVSGSLVGGLLYQWVYVLEHLADVGIYSAGVLAASVLAGVLIALACRLVVVLLAGRVRAAAALEHLRTP